MDNLAKQLEWNGIAYGVVAGIAALAVVALWLTSQSLRSRWLPVPRLRPGQWTGYHVLAAFLVWQGAQLIILVSLLRIGFFLPLLGAEPERIAPEMERTVYLVRCSYVSSPLVLAATLGVLFTVMFIFAQSRPPHFGLTWSRWLSNLALGFAAFIAGWPMIIGCYALLLLVFPKQSDPLELLAKRETEIWGWVLFGFQRVVVAPILEEVFFRGILQGWLRRATILGHVMLLLVILINVANDLVLIDAQGENISFNAPQIIPLTITFLGVAGYGCAMFLLARGFGLRESDLMRWQPSQSELPFNQSGEFASDEVVRELRQKVRIEDASRRERWANANANLAIFGQALLFAVIHPWPGAMALFLMGLLQGWLSRRTQSLVGPIAFHALFNLTALIAYFGLIWSA